jgi:hypothetical protein
MADQDAGDDNTGDECDEDYLEGLEDGPEEDAPEEGPPPPAKPAYVLHGDDPFRAPARVWAGAAVPVTVGPTWAVPTTALPHGALKAILADLTCEPNAKQAAKNPFRKRVTFCLGAVRAGALHMPPWYARAAFPDGVVVARTLTRGAPAAFGPFAGGLREHPPQQAAATRYFEWLRDKRDTPSCILSLPCGYGKTVLCLWLAQALGRVTLVLAHTNALVDQWLGEVARFLPEARVGHVKEGGDVVVDGVDIVVASLASLRPALARGDPWTVRLRAAVGLVVLDEGHHAVASTFWEVLGSIPAAYRLVLTATPRRGDGLGGQLGWVTGPVIFRAFRAVGEVYVANLCFTGEGHEVITLRGQLQLAEMVNVLCEDPARTALAVHIAAHLVLTQGRRVIVITPRVAHIHVLADGIEARLAAAGLAPRVVPVWVPHRWKAPPKKPVKRPRGGAGAGKAPRKALATTQNPAVAAVMAEAVAVAAAMKAAAAKVPRNAADPGPSLDPDPEVAARDAAHAAACEASWDAWLASEAATGALTDAGAKAAARATAADRGAAPAGGPAPWTQRRAWQVAGGPGHWEDRATPLVGRVLASMSTEARHLAFNAHVFVASDLLLREGVSVVEMDTLLSVANLKDVEQAAGRILRDCPTKKVPLIVDFYMGEGIFAGLHRARVAHYVDQGFQQVWRKAAGPGDIPDGFWDKYNKGGVSAWGVVAGAGAGVGPGAGSAPACVGGPGP